MSYTILGISASLRNARRGKGNNLLIEELEAISSREELGTYLEDQAQLHLEHFIEAGRKDETPFDEMYKNLKKLNGLKGLSNSEVCLASALWASKEIGGTIDHVSLSEYFSESKRSKNIEELKQKVKDADGVILSSPVYFGDRGSLAQSFINLIRDDKEFAAELQHKLYAGLAVGAKRNGGQETTLIYQLQDMINCGFLGVGNDSETTSQYGGTGLAGDIGTMAKDEYGLATAMGTGRRISRVASMMSLVKNHKLEGKHRIAFWILQDKDDTALNYIRDLATSQSDVMEAKIFEFAGKNIIRCLACDICPTHIDVDEEYRCIIKSSKDDMKAVHEEMLYYDAIIPVIYAPRDREGLQSNYQRFIERTRYFRRGDYVFSDVIAAPFVIEELGSNENMHIRLMTSMIRHHTVLSKPIIAYQKDGEILNNDEVKNLFERLSGEVREMTKARLLSYSSGVNHLKYKPVGYILSAHKDAEDEKLLKRFKMIERRVEVASEMADERLRKA